MKKTLSPLILICILLSIGTQCPIAQTITKENADIIICVGEKYRLEAIIKYMVEKQLPPDINVKWETTDSKIATVNAGIVIGVAEGAVIIKATAVNNGTIYSAEAKMYVRTTVTGVVLSKSNLDIKVGQTDQILESVLPDNAILKTVTWETSDATIATVRGGIIKGIREGYATIKVTTKDGGFSASCIVRVASTVTDVALADHVLTKKVGEEFIIKANILPEDAFLKEVKWISSNTHVLTISNGKIKAIGSGSAKVTVETVDGQHTDSCTVTVENVVTGITLNKNKITVLKGNKEMITATVLPAEAFEKSVTWKSDNPKIASVGSDGMITGVAVGVTIVRALSKDGNKEAAVEVAVISYEVGVTSIELADSEVTMNVGENRWFLFKVYPENAVIPKLKLTATTPDGKASAPVSMKNNIIYVVANQAADIILTVISEESPNIRDSCLIHIKSMVTGIEISNSNLDISVGEIKQLTGRALPDYAIVKGVGWKSTNPLVATIHPITGQAKGLSVGECLFIATTIDGGLERTCKVVVNNPIKVEGIELIDENGNIVGKAPNNSPADNQEKQKTDAEATGEKPISITIDGTPLAMDQPPILQNGRVLAPVRAIFEGLGATVYWNEDMQMVTGVLGTRIIQLVIDNHIAMVNGRSTQLDVPPCVIGDRTLVPVRFISESLGVDVQWDEATNTVIITTK